MSLPHEVVQLEEMAVELLSEWEKEERECDEQTYIEKIIAAPESEPLTKGGDRYELLVTLAKENKKIWLAAIQLIARFESEYTPLPRSLTEFKPYSQMRSNVPKYGKRVTQRNEILAKIVYWVLKKAETEFPDLKMPEASNAESDPESAISACDIVSRATKQVKSFVGSRDVLRAWREHQTFVQYFFGDYN